MRIATIASLIAVVLLPGCANRLETKVRTRAATDMSCPEDQLDVKAEKSSLMSGTYVASGCNDAGHYYARCGLIGICTVTPQGAAYASAPPPSYGGGGYGGGGSSAPPPSTSTAPASSGGSEPAASSSPPPPAVVSLTLRNTCSETVKIFFGDKPKFGSGTYSSIGSNTSTSKSMKPGDMIWIVDDGQNGLSSTTISEGVRTVEITKDCTGFSVR